MNNINDVYDFVYSWVDLVINNPLNVGNVTFTKNSEFIVGNNFVTNGLIANNYLRIAENQWYKIKDVVSETSIELYDKYRGITNTTTGFYSTVGYDITRGSQGYSSTKPEIILHYPPIANRRIGNVVNKKYRYVPAVIAPPTAERWTREYSNNYEIVLTIEQIGGDYVLNKLSDTELDDNIIDLFRTNIITLKNIFDASSNIMNLNNEFETSLRVDVTLRYVINKIEDVGTIESVDYSGTITR